LPAIVLQEEFTWDFYLLAWLRRHSLLAFFALTFGIDSARPYLVSSLPSLRHAPPYILAIVIALILIMFCGGPTLSSITLTGILGGKSGLRQLIRSAFNQDVDARWFITALFLPAAVVWLPIMAINALLGGPVPPIFNPPGGVLSWWELVLLLYGVFIALAWTEEIGWRGFALPRLQADRSALSSSIILGVIWGIWHLPDRLSSQDFSCSYFVLFVIWTIALSILFTWLYNNTKGNLRISIIFHAAINTTLSCMPIDRIEFFTLTVALMWVVAIIVVITFGPERLVLEPSKRSGGVEWLRSQWRNLLKDRSGISNTTTPFSPPPYG